MKKICLIIVYFGKLPRYTKVFLKTCAYNPSINWLIFTDQRLPEHYPRNVKFANLSLKDFNNLASKKLNLNVSIDNPYKVCDFRPAFGIIFSEYLTDYDFWGNTDLDIIYGDIRHFLTEEILKKYEIITSKEGYLAGHFTIYKNSPKINQLYAKTKDYKKVFSDKEHYAFDEFNFSFEKPNGIESMTHYLKNNQSSIGKEVLFKEMVIEDWYPGWDLLWERGKLTNFNENSEALYFHMLMSKHKPFFVPDWKRIPDKLYINKYGLSKRDEKRFLFKQIKILKNSIPSKYFVSHEIDKNLGKIGLLIKRVSPKTYLILSGLKNDVKKIFGQDRKK